MKASSVKGLLPEKKYLGSNILEGELSKRNGFNICVDQISSRELVLDIQKTSILIYKIFYAYRNTPMAIPDQLVDALNANLKDLLICSSG